MSIASSRRGRENGDRDENYFELRSISFAQQIAEWQESLSRPVTVTTPAFYAEQRRRMREMVEDEDNQPDEFQLWVSPLAEGESVEVMLNADGTLPPGTKVRRCEPAIYNWFLVCTNEFRNVIPERWVRFEGDGPIDITKAPVLTDDEFRAAMKEQRRIELEASRPAPPPPPPPRRQAVKVEGATFGFIPGSALAAETCDAAPVLPDTNAISDNDRFAVLAFHLPTKAVVSAVTACVRVPDSAYLALAIYNETGDRLVKADLRGDASGPVSATVEPPVELPAGNYRLGWAVWPTQPVKFQCLKLDRDSIEMLNAGEGEIVLGVSRGRADARLPKKLGEIEPAGERFPMPPKVLFKG